MHVRFQKEIVKSIQQSVQHGTTVERFCIAAGSEKLVPSSSRCFLASAEASASLIMPRKRSLAESRVPATRMEILMQQIRALGHLPGWTEEAPLALRLKRAKDAEELTASQLAELEAIRAPSRPLWGLCVILLSLWAVVFASDHRGTCVCRSYSFLGASWGLSGPSLVHSGGHV